MSANSLPEYENPPVVETILGVQFEPLTGFKNAHLGAFWKSLDSKEWPNVSDAVLLPAQFERFAEGASWIRGIQFQLTHDQSCRIQIKNAAGNRMVQLQNNRLHLNWLKIEGEDYPRYTTMRDEFGQLLSQLIEFAKVENFKAIQPNQWEITYINHISRGGLWNSFKDVDFFRPLGKSPTIEDLVDGESFGGEWHFAIPGQRGRLHVNLQTARKTESEEVVLSLTITARGPLATSDDQPIDSVIDGLDLGHEAIVRSFEAMMTEKANTYWGLKKC